MSWVSVDHAPLERSRLPVEENCVTSQRVWNVRYLSPGNHALEEDHVLMQFKENTHT